MQHTRRWMSAAVCSMHTCTCGERRRRVCAHAIKPSGQSTYGDGRVRVLSHATVNRKYYINYAYIQVNQLDAAHDAMHAGVCSMHTNTHDKRRRRACTPASEPTGHGT